MQSLAHIDTWLFDLDNTLYPEGAKLFAQIDVRIGAYVQRVLNLDPIAAHRVQKQWFIEHGTTLAGLMAELGTDPHHYLDDVHDIDMSALVPNPALAKGLAALPGRKIVFTNADAPYARKVLDRLEIADQFDAIHDVHASNYDPKPRDGAYRSLIETHRIDPSRALFFEDMARNLAPAKALGMTTVWIDNGSEQAPDSDRSFIDFITDDLSHWLETLWEPK